MIIPILVKFMYPSFETILLNMEMFEARYLFKHAIILSLSHIVEESHP